MFGNKGGFGSSNNKQDSEPTFDVYVKGVPPSVDESQLLKHFCDIGPVTGVTIKQARGDYKCNYAFVKFTTEEDALCAVKYLHNTPLENSNLQVSYRAKTSSTSGSESGGFGAGGNFQRQTSNDNKPVRGGFSNIRGRGGFSSRGGSSSSSSSSSGGFSQINKQVGFPKSSPTANGFGRPGHSQGRENRNEASNGVVSPPKEEKSVLKEQVLITHVDHPIKIWGQMLLGDVAISLDNIGKRLEAECPQLEKLSGSLPYGKLFACKFSVDDMWYRCKIEKQFPGQKLKIRYIDYGNNETVDQSSLVILPASLGELPPCAKEYTLDLKPASLDEDSDKFKQVCVVVAVAGPSEPGGVQLVKPSQNFFPRARQPTPIYAHSGPISESLQQSCVVVAAVEFLQKMVVEHVVNFETKSGENVVASALIEKSNLDIVKEILAAGHAVVNEEPKFIEDQSSFTRTAPNVQKVRPMRGASSFQASRENQELKNKVETMQAEMEKIKRERNELESQLEKQKSQYSGPVISTRLNKLVDEISGLKNLRDEVQLEEFLTVHLKTAVALIENKDASINLNSMTAYQELLQSEDQLLESQANVKNCQGKELFPDLIAKRDESRKFFLDQMQAFLHVAENLPFEKREAELQTVLADIKTQYSLSATTSDSSSVTEALDAYRDWRLKKIDIVKSIQSVANNCSAKLSSCMGSLQQKVDLNYQPMLIDIDGSDEQAGNSIIDDLIEKYSQAISSEITQMNESNINIEAKQMITNLVGALVKAIDTELNDINKLKNELIQYYETKMEKISHWINKVPDISKLKRARSTLKSLKSKFRHKQADRRDFEEDSDEKHQLAETEKEIEYIRNELHAVFMEEHKLLEELSIIADNHFPELPIQHSDLGIAQFLQTNGLLRTRELEHYDHHALPLLSSSTKQPVVYKTKFSQQPCVLKEYTLNDNCTKEKLKSVMVKYSKCKHENLVALDGLFFDKSGRKAYLQTEFYEEGCLLEYVKTKPHSKELHGFLHGILKCLACLHRNDVVHGSISPKSVFIKKENGQISAMLKEPNFAKTESERFKELANLTSSMNYPSIKPASEHPSAQFDIHCFGLLMLWACFPDATLTGDVESKLKDVVKDNPVGELLECMLNKVPSLRMTAEDLLMHSYFQTAQDRSQSPSEELLSTIKDLNDSYVNIEATSPLQSESEQVEIEADNVDDKNKEENANENAEGAKDNEEEEAVIVETEYAEVVEAMSDQTEQPKLVDADPLANSNGDDLEVFSEGWKI
eukprot:gene16626-18316_t